MKQYFVYILAGQRNGTLYVGSTSNLIQRIWQHKNSTFSSFTSKYRVHQLVYYEAHSTIVEMVRRERRFKNWCRKWKLNLIEQVNPAWQDLYDENLFVAGSREQVAGRRVGRSRGTTSRQKSRDDE